MATGVVVTHKRQKRGKLYILEKQYSYAAHLDMKTIIKVLGIRQVLGRY